MKITFGFREPEPQLQFWSDTYKLGIAYKTNSSMWMSRDRGYEGRVELVRIGEFTAEQQQQLVSMSKDLDGYLVGVEKTEGDFFYTSPKKLPT